MTKETLKEHGAVDHFFSFAQGKEFVATFLYYVCEKHYGVGYEGIFCSLPGDLEPWDEETPFNGILFRSEYYGDTLLEYKIFLDLVNVLADEHLVKYPDDETAVKKYNEYLSSGFLAKCAVGYKRDLEVYREYIDRKNA